MCQKVLCSNEPTQRVRITVHRAGVSADIDLCDGCAKGVFEKQAGSFVGYLPQKDCAEDHFTSLHGQCIRCGEYFADRDWRKYDA